jgi:hypothetical protein
MSQNSNTESQGQTPFATLRRFIRARANIEQCELCSVAVAAEHQHLLEPLSRKLICACDACALLFGNQSTGKYRRVPRRIRFLLDFRLTDAQWESLLIPINMAFFFYSTPAAKVIALYPSPAGPTESLLSLESWDEIVRENPILQGMEPDVEALLVNRVRRGGSARAEAEYYLAPIDECYKLTGLIRAHWRGLSGGTEVWEAIARFFTSLQERAVKISEATRA